MSQASLHSLSCFTITHQHEQLIHGPAALRDELRTIFTRIKTFSGAFKTEKSETGEDG